MPNETRRTVPRIFFQEYLESSLRYLHHKFVEDVNGHRTDNIKASTDSINCQLHSYWLHAPYFGWLPILGRTAVVVVTLTRRHNLLVRGNKLGSNNLEGLHSSKLFALVSTLRASQWLTSYCIVCQVMQENMLLVKEINMQRGHNKAAKRVLEAQVTGIQMGRDTFLLPSTNVRGA